MSKSEEKRVPELRFKGFTEDWEQRKLKLLSKITTGGTPSTKKPQYWNPKEIPWMSSGEINKRRIIETDDKISILGLENSSAKYVEERSVLIALAGQGKTRGIVALNYIPLTTNQSLAAISPNELINPEFLYHNLDKRYEELRRLSSGDGSRGGLNKKLLESLTVKLTNIEEQESISKLLNSIDNLIELHQRKASMLREVRTAFIQNLYAEYNNVFPNLKFKETDSKWLATSLGNLLTEFTNKSIVENQEILLSSTNYGIERRLGRVSGSSNLGYKLIEVGDLVLSPQNLWLGNININSLQRGIVSPSYKTFKIKDIDSLFLEPILRSPRMLYEYEKSSTQGASVVRRNLDSELFNQIKIKQPDEDTKERIGVLLKTLETLLTTHEYLINRVQTIKNQLLLKMFI